MSKKIDYKPEICECCGQTKTYLYILSRGHVITLQKIAKFISDKGINVVHLRKEMTSEGLLTSSQFNNVSCLRMHGLVAKVKGEAGNYLLTKKGASFLKGKIVPKMAIIRKSTSQTSKHNIGYYLEDEVICTARMLLKSEDYWEGINFTIENGRIIRDEVEQTSMFGKKTDVPDRTDEYGQPSY